MICPNCHQEIELPKRCKKCGEIICWDCYIDFTTVYGGTGRPYICLDCQLDLRTEEIQNHE